MVIEYFMEWVQSAPVRKREAAAAAMVRAYLDKRVSEAERDDLEAALTVLLEDNAPGVRLVIAETFGAFAAAPRHIMSALASDVAEISMNVLSCSPVFHDSELVSFVRKNGEDSQIAISCRPWLSPAVIEALCDCACRDANFGLLMNPAAELEPVHLHRIAERFGTDTEIRNILLEHRAVACETRHLLIGKLGESLSGFLRKKSWLPEHRLERLMNDVGDRASIIFAANVKTEAIQNVVRNLIREDRLTVAFLVRAICMGNIALVACALSELSGVRFSRVEAILGRDRETAFRAVYDRAGLPKSAFLVFRTAIATWRRLLSSGSKINQARLPFIVTREVLDAYAGGTDPVTDELLVLLRRLAAEAARENSRAKAQEIIDRKQSEEKLEIGDADDAQIVDEHGDIIARPANDEWQLADTGSGLQGFLGAHEVLAEKLEEPTGSGHHPDVAPDTSVRVGTAAETEQVRAA